MAAKKRCKYCLEYGYDHLRINGRSFCDRDHAMKWAVEKNEKERLKVAKREKKETAKAGRLKHREDKERIKSMTEWFDQLGRLVNQYVLHIRDKGKPCCTCGKSAESIKYDAGHYRSRGSCKELRFELTNIHKQCSMNCNVIGSGMRAEYREFITGTYGADHLEWLDSKHPLLKDVFPHYLDVKAEIARYRVIIREGGLTPVA